LVLILGSIWQYGASRSPIIQTIICNALLICFALGLYLFLALPGLKYQMIILFLAIAILVTEKSRISFFLFAPGVIAYLYHDKRVIGLKTLALAVITMVVLCVFVGIIRMGGEMSDLRQLFMPILWETIYGSYPLLNAINIEIHENVSYYMYGLSYLVDPIINAFPRILVENKDEIVFLQQWRDVHMSFVPEASFSPVGGWWYGAELIMNFGFYGGIICHFFIGLAFAWLDRLRNLYFRYAVLGAIGCTFLTEQFYQSIRYLWESFIFVFLFLVFLNLLFSKRPENVTYKRTFIKP
jgi:hypothetical protein